MIRWVRRLWHAFGVDQCIFADTVRIDYETLEHVVNIEQKYTRNDAKTGLSPVFEAVGASKRQNSRSLPMFRMPLVTGTGYASGFWFSCFTTSAPVAFLIKNK
ncbi:unnamed protein product [Phytophthora fragariaefolia]|uniref:Unnamed protein product n=1 Tax=Phytophthora fragariaefolia TaxID=1490495 RepID=A0A9W6XV49_9STRA|nr:unnamed protein product [Phytophthora fragariaefolia]